MRDATLRLATAFAEDHPGDAARALEGRPTAEAAAALAECPAPAGGRVLERMTAQAAADTLAELEPGRAADLLSRMPAEVAASVLRRAPSAVREAVLAQAERGVADTLGRLLAYPPHATGALMDPRAPAVAVDHTAGEALALITSHAGSAGSYVYVVDRDERPVGATTLARLLAAPAHAALVDLMTSPVTRVHAGTSLSDLLEHPGWRRHHALPVVDGRGALVGVVRHEAIRRLESERAQAPIGADTIGTLLAIGEVLWLALATLLGAGEGPARPPRTARTDDGH